MKPDTFVKLAMTAAVSTLAAIAAYAASNPWGQGRIAGAKLLPQLSANADVAGVAVTQAGTALTLLRKEGRWGLEERGGYPADPEKVRALLVKLQQSELIEPKTRNPDRHAMLELEDPAGKEAKSRGIRLLDRKGTVLADIVVGKKRFDAFGSGKGGSYVRRAGDPQAWLANAEIDAPADVKGWIKPAVLEAESAKISRLTIEIAGEPALTIERGADGKAAFAGLPTDKKLKDASAADSILAAAASIEAEDVRRPAAPPLGAGVGSVSFAMRDGLEVALELRKEGEAHWLSIAPKGEGDAKAAAEAIRSRTSGWEFNIPRYKADALLKRRGDLYEGG
jgi:hypothetical protein